VPLPQEFLEQGKGARSSIIGPVEGDFCIILTFGAVNEMNFAAQIFASAIVAKAHLHL
jgi:hypothetical protein